MPRSILAIVVLFMIAGTGLPVDAETQLMNGTVVEITKVREGDVFRGRVVETGEKVELRLLGVDCVDRHDRPAAQYARKNLVGQRVEVSSEQPPIPPAMDQLDRWVVYIGLENGADYGAELLRAGHCTSKTWSMRHPRKADYESAEPS